MTLPCRRHGLGIGKALVAAIIESAQTLGYAEMKLDTLASMPEAFALCSILRPPVLLLGCRW